MMHGPARLFVDPDPAFLIDLLVRQGIAIVVYTILVAFVYRLAVRRINANGG
jgi:hypothetical protein